MDPWKDVLTIGNVELFCLRLEKLLKGVTYSFSANYEDDGSEPAIEPRVRLAQRPNGQNPVQCWYGPHKCNATFSVTDTTGTWGCPIQAHAGVVDTTFQHPHFEFEGKSFRLKFRESNGKLMVWEVIVLD